MNKLGWLQAEKDMRLRYLQKQLTGNIVEYDDMLTEYVLLIRDKLEWFVKSVVKLMDVIG